MPGARAARHAMQLCWAACALSNGLWLTGCEPTTLDQLSGHWVGHRVESLDGSVSAARAGWAKGTSLMFDGDRIGVTVPGEAPRWGSFRVLEEHDGELTLAITGHDGHVDPGHFTVETEELLRWHVSNVHTLVLHRPP